VRIDVIESNADFTKIRENWDSVYAGDPHAQYFLSWQWLYGYLHRRDRWFILALREKEQGSPYVAFFPLRLVTRQDPKTGICTDDIIMAGNHAADYTGILCEPAYEARAIEGFSLFLKDQSWTHIRLDNFSGPVERHDALVQAFRGPDIGHKRTSRVDNRNIDHAVCPVVTLPDSWEAYLETKLSSQTRQKLRRFLRQVESDEAYRITVASAGTIEADLDILFKLWHAKWHMEKGDRIESIITSAREVLMDAFQGGELQLFVLWHNERPLGAIANMLDRVKKSVLFYIAGRDEEWKTPSPGLVLHGHAIRLAISEGYRSYDFLRGNELYKYAFGVEDRPLHCSTLRTATSRNRFETLNLRSVRYVYELGRRLCTEGNKALAEAAFEQVVAASPAHIGARMALAQLQFEKGRLSEAESAYQGILAATTDRLPVLLRLGDTQIALKKFPAAATTFGEAIELQPNCSVAHYSKGVALVAAGQVAAAVSAFDELCQLNSDDPAHAQFQSKARDALVRLSPALAPPTDVPKSHPLGFPLEPVTLSERLKRDFGRKVMTSTTPGPTQPGSLQIGRDWEQPSSAAAQRWDRSAARTKH
jgi:CelD/BcsL family acetyltransferase involved in cellulose biosynthesis